MTDSEKTVWSEDDSEEQSAPVPAPSFVEASPVVIQPGGATPAAVPVQKSQTPTLPVQEADAAIQVGEEKKDENKLPELSPEQAAYPWYVVHTYSGFESRAKLSLEERIRMHGLEKLFGNILVPQENVVELVRGQKKTSKRKVFPGYILVQCKLTDDTWHLVNDTPKITGFVGDTREPFPISAQEVATLTEQLQGGGQKARPKVQFEQGDAVKVVDGPFADFNGTVDEVKPDKGKLRVLISIFGRNTPVELDFIQVERAE